MAIVVVSISAELWTTVSDRSRLHREPLRPWSVVFLYGRRLQSDHRGADASCNAHYPPMGSGVDTPKANIIAVSAWKQERTALCCSASASWLRHSTFSYARSKSL